MLIKNLLSAQTTQVLRGLGPLALLIAASGLFLPLNAQNILLVAVDPPSASSGIPISVTASGFTPGATVGAVTVTLTPQLGGPTVFATGTVQGSTFGRSINFTAPVGAAGPYNLTISGSGLSSTNSLVFTLLGQPSFTLNPATGVPSQTLQVTITGINTTFPPNLTTARFGPGISVGGALENQFGPVSVQPNGTAIATITINAGATLGGRTVDVIGALLISQPNAFTVVAGTRTLTLVAVDPPSAGPGIPVSITASGFESGAAVPTMTVTLSPQGGGAPILVTGTTQGSGIGRSVNFNVPAAAPPGVYNVTLSATGYVSANSLPFTITVPAFTLSPSTGSPTQTLQVVITPQNTLFPLGTTANFGSGISVGGALEGQAGPVAVQPNGTAIATITINASAALGGRTVTVTGVHSITQANAFTIVSGTRTLTLVAVDPSSAGPNIPVSITASGFAVGVPVATLTVTMTPQGGGTPITITGSVQGSGLGRSINFAVPPGTPSGPYNLTVSGPGYTSGNSLPFTLTQPSFTLNPNTGAPGQTLQVVITGMQTNFPAGNTTANFGVGISVGGAPEGTAGPVAVQPNGTAIATIVINPNTTLGGRTVTVIGQDNISQANAFTVATSTNNLTLGPITPDNGPVNTNVSLTASGFPNGIAAPTFTITLTPQGGGAPVVTTGAAIGTGTSRTIVFSIPAGAAVGPYNVTASATGYTSLNSVVFTVTSPTKTLTLLTINPSAASPNASVAVTASGFTLNEVIAGLTVTLTPQGGGAPITTAGSVVGSGTTRTINFNVPAGSPAGAYNVTLSGSGYVSGNSLPFTVNPPASFNLNPNSGQQGQSVQVVITGLFTTFPPGTTTANFGAGISVGGAPEGAAGPVVVQLDGTAIASLVINPAAATGPRTVTVAGTDTITQPGAFTVVSAPQIISVVPNSGQAGQTLSVTITGSNTSFSASSTVSLGAGIVTNSIVFNSPTSLTANITISSGATPGLRDVTVTTAGTPITAVNAFTVNPAEAQQILSVVPSNAQAGSTLSVTITGQGTAWASGSTVSLGAGITVNSVLVNSATSITASITIDAGAAPGARDVTVTTGGTPLVGPGLFTVNAIPGQITSVNPNSGQQSQTLNVTITGTNTNFSGASSVSFGAGITTNSVIINSGTSLTANITIAPGAVIGFRDVTVTTNTTTVVGSNAFSVTAGPQITSVVPNSGQQGQTLAVTITGSNTSFTAGSTVSFGAGVTTNSVTFNSATSLTASISIASNAALGARDVTVATAGSSVVGSGLFSVLVGQPQQITSVNPTTGQQGQSLSVVITGSGTSFGATSTVSFGSGVTVTSITIGSPTSITAGITIAPGAVVGARDVVVTTSGTAVTGAGLFTVTAAPSTISGVTPSSGQQGQSLPVAITGTNTNFAAGSSTVSFGAGVTVNSVTVNSPTSLIANISIAPNATIATRDVSVTTAGTTVTGIGLFSVTQAQQQQITSVSPNTGQQGTTIGVTITGSGTSFAAGSTVTFGSGITVNSVTVNSATSISANITIAANAILGPHDVAVTTSGSTVTGLALFTVLAPPQPTISSVSPNSGQQGQTLSVTITGSNTSFVAGSTVSFGTGVTVNSVTVNSATSITASITVDANATVGPRDVTVTTSGTTATGSGLFSVVAASAPRIISINPAAASPGQTATLIITGEATNFQQGTTQVSLGAGVTINSITVTSPTTISVSITVANNAALGARDVTVTSGGQTLTLANGFAIVLASSNVPFTCTANAGVPPLLRAEGFTELVGDIVIVCTGGNAGQTNTVNLQIFLNAPITSRIVSGTSEALLILDENPIVANIFRASLPVQGDNSVVWAGLPIAQPGPFGQRVLRITNVRANASAVGVSTSLVPSQIFAFISASPSQSLPLNNPQQLVGYVQPGMQFDVRTCNNSDAASANFAQCVGENSSGTRDLINGTNGAMQFALRFREGFQTAFKTQVAANQIPSVPGMVYNSESGFIRTPDLPFAVGGADTGTRLAARFMNLPAGTRLFVTTVPSFGSTTGFNAVLVSTGSNGQGGVLQPGSPLAVASTATLFCPTAGSEGIAAAELTVTNGSALAVWEVTAANPAALETAMFGVGVAYAPNTPNNLPGLGQASVLGSFAPFYAASSDAGKMSATLPIPRFIDNASPNTAFRIDPCVTNLLFPFVTNQAGFDTGIAVSNTSRDPFGNALRPQAGACTVNYYGNTAGGGAAPPPQKTNGPVPAGSTLTFVLSSGGNFGIAGTPGFQGYLIVQCEFRYGHGFAFITDGPIGSARVAEGYLGLVMDNGIATRGSLSESLKQ